MIYSLVSKRAFTLDTNPPRMILMLVGDEVKIEDTNVYIRDPDSGDWHLTIDMVSQYLMESLKDI